MITDTLPRFIHPDAKIGEGVVIEPVYVLLLLLRPADFAIDQRLISLYVIQNLSVRKHPEFSRIGPSLGIFGAELDHFNILTCTIPHTHMPKRMLGLEPQPLERVCPVHSQQTLACQPKAVIVFPRHDGTGINAFKH